MVRLNIMRVKYTSSIKIRSNINIYIKFIVARVFNNNNNKLLLQPTIKYPNDLNLASLHYIGFRNTGYSR